MPDTETAAAPTPDTTPINPFAAALEKAIAEPKEPTPELKQPEAEKQPEKATDKKDATPRELFNKAAKGDEKKPDAQAVEPKSAVDEIAPPDFKGDTKAKAGWDVLKKEAKAQESAARANEARAKELEAKLSEYEPLKKQIEERDAKLKEYDEIVARARIEEHPEFRREFIDGRAKLMSRAKAIIEESGGDAKAIETALNLKGKPRVDALREVAGELDNFQSGRLGRVIDELSDLDERAEAKREKAKQSYEELREQERTRELEGKAKRQQTRALEFDDTAKRLRGELEVLNKADGHDDWNARADSILKDARAHVDAHPEADIEAEILARSIPAYRELFLQADKKVEASEKKIAELEAELKAIHGKSPSIGARSSATGGDKPARPFSAALAGILNGGE